MRLRPFILLCVLLAPSKLLAAEACVVVSNDLQPYREALAGFEQSFPGTVHDFNLKGSAEGASALLKKLEKTRCDLYVGFGSLAFDFLSLRTTEKPIVYAVVLNVLPQKRGGRPVAGVRLEPDPDQVLEAIETVLPAARRIGVLYSPALTQQYVDEAKRAAKRHGRTLVPIAVQSIGETVHSAQTLAKSADLIWMIADAVTSSKLVFEQLLVISFQRGIPLFGLSPRHARHAALLALEVDYRAHGEKAAEIAGRLAAGNARDVGQHATVPPRGIVINRKTARKLGLPIPEAVYRQAVSIFE